MLSCGCWCRGLFVPVDAPHRHRVTSQCGLDADKRPSSEGTAKRDQSRGPLLIRSLLRAKHLVFPILFGFRDWKHISLNQKFQFYSFLCKLRWRHVTCLDLLLELEATPKVRLSRAQTSMTPYITVPKGTQGLYTEGYQHLFPYYTDLEASHSPL